MLTQNQSKPQIALRKLFRPLPTFHYRLRQRPALVSLVLEILTKKIQINSCLSCCSNRGAAGSAELVVVLAIDGTIWNAMLKMSTCQGSFDANFVTCLSGIGRRSTDTWRGNTAWPAWRRLNNTRKIHAIQTRLVWGTIMAIRLGLMMMTMATTRLRQDLSTSCPWWKWSTQIEENSPTYCSTHLLYIE